MSQITPDTFLHQFHPPCTLFFTSLSQLPLSCTVDPKYLNSFTLGTFVSSIFTVSSSFPPFMHRYSVFDLFTFISLLSNAYLQDSSLCSTFPWSLHKSEYHQQIASSTVVLSLLYLLACPLLLQTGTDLTLILSAVQP